MRILVVENDSDHRLVYEVMFQDQMDATCVGSIEAALEQLDRQRFDVAIIDIHLGAGDSGQDLLSAMRERYSEEMPKTVACTAYAMPGDEEKYLSSGFDAYVRKPFIPDELLKMVEQLGTPDQ
jgi:two-component system, cell cycle response regulator DivK